MDRRKQRNGNAGSSPLSRGIRHIGSVLPLSNRIIPALAGNTSLSAWTDGTAKDHPRSRGEYRGRDLIGVSGIGSSPLSRGILHAVVADPFPEGIIPALAGNTSGGCRGFPRWPDHPRSRGEYPHLYIPRHGVQGSSPLSRGIPDVAAESAQACRIIPALAGNTIPFGSVIRMLGDHPRSRGEYPPSLPLMVPRAGSSPLSRGIPIR